MAKEVLVQQGLAQLLQGPHVLAGWAQSQAWRGCKRGLPELCTMPPDQSWLSLGQESTGCYPPGTRRLGSEGTLVFAGTCLWGWPQPTVAHTQNLELLPHTLVRCLSLYLCLSWSEAPFMALVWGTAVWEPPFAELWGGSKAQQHLCARSVPHPVQPAAAQPSGSRLVSGFGGRLT